MQENETKEWNEYVSTLTMEHHQLKKAAEIYEKDKNPRSENLKAHLKSSQSSQSNSEL